VHDRWEIIGADHFERYLGFEARIIGFEYSSHATLAKWLQEIVSSKGLLCWFGHVAFIYMQEKLRCEQYIIKEFPILYLKSSFEHNERSKMEICKILPLFVHIEKLSDCFSKESLSRNGIGTNEMFQFK